MLDNLNLGEIVLPNETKHQIYLDGAQPTVSETGKLVGRIPRAINAALSGLDQWILQREYNVAETKKSLEEKLSTVDPNKIVAPEPYIAVPAFQAISYSMSNSKLHELYANLLSKAMFEDTKSKVHPAFVDIIKQMSPTDALVLKEINSIGDPLATAQISIILKQRGLYLIGQPPVHKTYSMKVFDLKLPNVDEQFLAISIENLERLGLVKIEHMMLTKSGAYAFVKKTDLYAKASDMFESLKGTDEEPSEIEIDKFWCIPTNLGELFCEICIDSFDY